MKPLYWKTILILGAVIVGASLAVPKALRKNAPLVESKTTQDVFLAHYDQNSTVQPTSPDKQDAVVVTIKYIPSHNQIKNTVRNNAKPVFTTQEAENLARSLNAGTRPTKMRVVK